MKTKVILEAQNDYAKQTNHEFDKEYMKGILLALLENEKSVGHSMMSANAG